jgi:peptidoglycan hydrolase-like protein with peptidoglycan-binding domain
MSLQSDLFSDDSKLEACLTNDSAHIKQGDVGPHVSKLHTALFAIDHLSVSPDELQASMYGPSTAKAVLAFKTKRKIINLAYEKRVDNIVGKMTIAALDKEMCRLELQPRDVPDKSSYQMSIS